MSGCSHGLPVPGTQYGTTRLPLNVLLVSASPSMVERSTVEGSTIWCNVVTSDEKLSWNKVLGANERVLLGVIGPGSRGQSVLQKFLKNSDVEVVALCEIYDENLKKTQTLLAKSVKEFIAHAKANSGKITFASSGTGTSTHLSGELFKRMTGIEMTHVPYRGVALALNDVIPGRVDVMFNTMAGVLQQVRAGQLRGLAVTTPERFPTAPEFPTVADTVPGFDVSSWYALFLPAKTPVGIVRKLHADTVAVLADPPVKTKLERVGVMVVGSTPDQLAAQLKSETELWGPVIKAAGIKPEG